MKHSPEPWEAVGGWIYIREGPIGRFCDGSRPETLERDQANTRRAVNCVNALAGVSDAVVESGAIGKLLDELFNLPVKVYGPFPRAPMLEAFLNHAKRKPPEEE